MQHFEQSMVNLVADEKARGARIRTITTEDIPAVCELLTTGFPKRGRDYWTHALDALARRNAPENYPRYGYLIENGREIVGVILTIFSALGGEGGVRCNLSSWYVDPRYRLGGYASALIASALRFKEVTYVNVSPARHTWPIIEAQGFRRYSDGQMLCFPLLSRRTGRARARAFDVHDESAERLAAHERELLIAHQAYGCQTLIVDREGCVSPFVFLPRRVFHDSLPTLQLLYCRSFEDFVQNAHVLGLALVGRWRFSILVDAVDRPKGLTGIFLPNRGPKYFKGPHQPRLGDLSYCESVLFGS